MNQFYIFAIRAVLGVVFSLILARVFFGTTNATYVAGLAVILVGLAYFSEYLRNKRSG